MREEKSARSRLKAAEGRAAVGDGRARQGPVRRRLDEDNERLAFRATILRPFTDSDQAAVRELFIAINRALAPADMKETFERYIETALAAEIDRLAGFYSRERGNGFWVAHSGPLLIGTVGLERASPHAVELRRMYVRAEFRRRGIAQALLERVTAAPTASATPIPTSRRPPPARPSPASRGYILRRIWTWYRAGHRSDQPAFLGHWH